MPQNFHQGRGDIGPMPRVGREWVGEGVPPGALRGLGSPFDDAGDGLGSGGGLGEALCDFFGCAVADPSVAYAMGEDAVGEVEWVAASAYWDEFMDFG